MELNALVIRSFGIDVNSELKNITLILVKAIATPDLRIVKMVEYSLVHHLQFENHSETHLSPQFYSQEWARTDLVPLHVKALISR